jgi:hypothetical protein
VRPRLLPPVLVAGLVLLAACGSSGSRAATPVTTKPPGTPADRRIGEAALLRVVDASGFQQVTPSPSVIADLAGSAAGVDACKEYLAGIRRRVLTGRAAGLQRGTTIVDSSIAVYADAATAQQQLALFRAASMPDCLRAVYQPQGTRVAVTPVTIDPVGDESVAYRIAPASRPEATTGIDVIVVRVGRVLISLNVTGSGADASEVLRTAAAPAVDRVRAAETSGG